MGAKLCLVLSSVRVARWEELGLRSSLTSFFPLQYNEQSNLVSRLFTYSRRR